MSNCDHNCNECSQECSERPTNVSPNQLSDIKKVIAVASGKGGVGKSLITSLLAVLLQRKGYKTAVLDADITGPSIPKMFAVKGKIMKTNEGLLPLKTKTGIQIMSSNLLLPKETDPVLWRGPLIAGLVKQFWTDVIWENVDFLFVDMPPGTGDVPLTVFQNLNVDGIIIVTSPQELVSMIVSKAVNMAKMMNIPVLGIIENMSYLECEKCHHHMKIFGESNVDKVAQEYGLNVIAKVPLNPQIASLCDQGNIEDVEMTYLDKGLDILENLPINVITIAIPVENGKIKDNINESTNFNIYKIVKKRIAKVYNISVENRNILELLENNYVNVLICNEINENIKKELNSRDISFVNGKGDALENVQKFVKNKII